MNSFILYIQGETAGDNSRTATTMANNTGSFLYDNKDYLCILHETKLALVFSCFHKFSKVI